MLQEVQLRRRRHAHPGRLSLRDFGALLCPVECPEQQALQCGCDREARSRLYLLRHAERCPGCGVHVQRHGEASACPEVSCPLCRRSFRCTKTGEHGREVQSLSVQARQQLGRAVAQQAQAAEELEKDRQRLARLLGENATVLSDVFSFLAQGRQSFSLPDLRLSLREMR